MLQTFWSWRCQGVFFLVGQILAGWVLVGLVPVQAETSSGVVISGFQVSGGAGHTNEEYVELFNSTTEPVDISGWRLAKLTKTGAPGNWTYLMAAFSSGTILSGHTFALAVHSDAAPIFGGDWQYGSSTLAEDNSVALLDANGAAIDLVGWGQAVNFTGQALPAAGAGRWARNVSAGSILGEFTRSEDGPRQGLVDNIAPVVENSTPTSTAEGVFVTSTEAAVENETTSTPEISEPALEVNQNVQNVILSEVYSQPNTGESEYVELYNPNDGEVILDDWRLVEGGGSVTAVTGTIAAKGFFVVTPIRGSLNNSGDEVQLWHGDEMIETVAYGAWDEAVVMPIKGQSVLRTEMMASGAWVLGGASPGVQNAALAVVEEVVEEEDEEESSNGLVGKLKISEVLPDPVGADGAEFIELFNPTTAAITINQWRLEIAGQEFLLPDQVIVPGAYVVFYRTQSKLVLPNRKKEKIRLLRADGSLSDSVSYVVPAVTGAAWLNVPGRGWEWSQSSTPGVVNVWKQLNRAPYAEITGPAEALPGEVVTLNSDNVFDPDQDALQYHWDLGDGSQTTSTGISTVYEKVGKYKIVLTVTDPFGLKDEVEWIIKVTAPVISEKPTTTVASVKPKTVTGAAPKPPAKKAVSTTKVAAKPKATTSTKITAVVPKGPALPVAARLLAENDGKLVSIKGEITSGSGKYWRLDDGTNEVVVILPATKQPTGFGLKKGTVWQVSGVVKKYKEDWAVEPSEWGQLQVVGKELAQTKKVPAMPVNTDVVKKLWWLIPGVSVIVLIYLGIRKRKAGPALIPVSVV